MGIFQIYQAKKNKKNRLLRGHTGICNFHHQRDCWYPDCWYPRQPSKTRFLPKNTNASSRLFTNNLFTSNLFTRHRSHFDFQIPLGFFLAKAVERIPEKSGRLSLDVCCSAPTAYGHFAFESALIVSPSENVQEIASRSVSGPRAPTMLEHFSRGWHPEVEKYVST